MPLSDDIKRIKAVNRVHILLTLMKKHGRKCWYCGDSFTSFKEVEIDHIVPRSRGGTSNIHNLAIACITCNRAKLDTPLSEFLHWLHKPKQHVEELDACKNVPEEQWSNYGKDILKGLRKPTEKRKKRWTVMRKSIPKQGV